MPQLRQPLQGSFNFCSHFEMSWSEVADTVCPIARALAVVGDRWTLLVLRELFLGTRRFDDLQAQTAMSPPLLSSRLKRLQADGVLTRCRYSERPVRHEYRLTDKGLAFYPVLLALKGWGEAWGGFLADADSALNVTHRDCGGEITVVPRCSACNEDIGARAATIEFGQSFADERQERRDAA